MSTDDLTHENSVIACAILGMTSGVKLLAENDYLDPRNRLIAAAVLSLLNREIKAEPTTIADELERMGRLREVGGRSALMYRISVDNEKQRFVGENAAHYAEQVRKAARVRRIDTLSQQLHAAVEADAAREWIDDTVHQFRREIDKLPPELGGEVFDGTKYWARTLSELPDNPEDWLIPGLLARGDRVMVTGYEGYGKSSFLMQVSACVAAGVNPFNGRRVADGARVLTIDCENQQRRIRSGVKMIQDRIRRKFPSHGWDEDRWWINYDRSAGMNLLGARDQQYLRDFADKARPDLIVIGPMYRLMYGGGGNPNDDADMQAVQAILDEVRVRHNAALIIEAHSPHGIAGERRATRPRGSSVQLGWPEVGFGLRPDERQDSIEERQAAQVVYPGRVTHMELSAWRGFREDRDWPQFIRYGRADRGELPWVPTDDWAPSVDTDYRVQPGLYL